MITAILSMWQAKKWIPLGIGIIAVTLVFSVLTVGIKSYAQYRINAEEQRRKDEIATAVQKALADTRVTDLQVQFKQLSEQLEQEKLAREQVDKELQALRADTEKTVQRIQRRQSELAKLLLEKPIETAAALSTEYNELNRSLK